MNEPDKRIIEFIKKHHVLTMATSNKNMPYCANCFYVYMEDKNALVFSSDKTTKHIQDIEGQNIIAGSIVLETNIIGKIQGVQFQGIIKEPEGELLIKAKKAYLNKFPVSMLIKTTLWVTELTFIKFTDNRLGFGKKLIWRKEINI